MEPPEGARMQRSGLDSLQPSSVHSPTAPVCGDLLSGLFEQAVLSHQEACPETSSGQSSILDTGDTAMNPKTLAFWPKQSCHQRQPRAGVKGRDRR